MRLTNAAVIWLALTTSLSAATVDGAATGLASPDAVVSFDEGSLPNGTTVTTQFLAQGITVSPSVTLLTSYSARPNFTGAALFNTAATPVSILFDAPVSDATIALSHGFATPTISALLSGAPVESFSTALTINPNGFYGFTDSAFDELRIDPGSAGFMALDTLSYNSAATAVPAPLSALLLLSGAAALSAFRRRPR